MLDDVAAARGTVGEYMEAMVTIAADGCEMPVTDKAGPVEWLWAAMVADARRERDEAVRRLDKSSVEPKTSSVTWGLR